MDYIRNVCILAHVDHGKTSLADNLLYSNGIISKHSAGDLRHLDSTQDEQERGITMKVSCISLKHLYKNKFKSDSETKSYIINLIDSPGHVDFNGEVSTAVKISDNAFIIVDVVEGVSSQTRTVIQQAWNERLNFILVLNKIDKMYTELKLDSSEVYSKLDKIIQEVHHIIGELISLDVREEEERTDTILTADEVSRKYDTNPFNPLKGKVIFCSAYHQWGFRISDFVGLYSKMLDIEKIDLFKKMWGDFYLNSKKKICKGAFGNAKKNIFTSLILDQIWSVYNAFGLNEIDKICRMMEKLDIDIKLKTNTRQSSQIDNIRTVFRRWMPLPTVLFDTLVEKSPNPREAMTKQKLSLLVPNETFSRSREILELASTNKNDPVVVFITKFMFRSHSTTELIGLGRIYSGQVKADLKMFAFTPRFNPYKVSKSFFSMTPDDFEEGPISVYEDETSQYSDAYVTRLGNVYQFMGEDQILLKDGAHAGYIVGFTGLDSQQSYKNVTLVAKCSLQDSLGMFCQYNSSGTEGCNVICVSVEPKKVVFLNELQQALRLLEKSDPIVNVSISSTGEMLVYAAGEIHLQRCLNELSSRIAPHIEVDVSPPIVPFRETIIHRAFCDVTRFESIRALSEELKAIESNVLKADISDLQSLQHQQGIKESIVLYIRLPQKTGTRLCCRISIHALPQCLVNFIEKNSQSLFQMNKYMKSRQELTKSNCDQKNHLLVLLRESLEIADTEDQENCQNSDVVAIKYSSLLDHLWAFGNSPSTQCNMLFSYTEDSGLFNNDQQLFDPFPHAIIKGFQRALKEGPICQELMKNVAFIVHEVWEAGEDLTRSAVVEGIDAVGRDQPPGPDQQPPARMQTSEEARESGSSDSEECRNSSYGFVCNPGQMSAAVTKACQTALMCHPGARLMIATYKLELEVRITTYKQLSSLISQLHGQITRQDVNFGNFVVEARIPVIESFGFGDKLRKKTSGEVGLPQLNSVTWELLDCPPLLDQAVYRAIVGCDEINDIGISQELMSRTQKYINSVRLRKGIQVRQQLIEFGDKQRTLNKKK